MAVKVEDKSLREFLEAVKNADIRRVLLTDYATVEPKHQGGAVVLVGMVQVVATALDRKPAPKVIYRWSEKDESERMVTITAGTGRGRNPGGRLAPRKEQVFQVLREEGLEVDEGEWTPATAEAYLASRKSIVG
jgi:hypothetical protein